MSKTCVCIPLSDGSKLYTNGDPWMRTEWLTENGAGVVVFTISRTPVDALLERGWSDDDEIFSETMDFQNEIDEAIAHAKGNEVAVDSLRSEASALAARWGW